MLTRAGSVQTGTFCLIYALQRLRVVQNQEWTIPCPFPRKLLEAERWKYRWNTLAGAGSAGEYGFRWSKCTLHKYVSVYERSFTLAKAEWRLQVSVGRSSSGDQSFPETRVDISSGVWIHMGLWTFPRYSSILRGNEVLNFEEGLVVISQKEL